MNNLVNVGLIVGVFCIIIFVNFIVNLCCLVGNSVNIVNCINGKRMLVLIVWIIWDIIKIVNVGENVVIIDFIRKIVIEKIYKWCVEYLFIKKVVSGIIILLISINLVINYCVVVFVMFSFLMIVGSVVFKIVWLSIDIKVLMSIIVMIVLCLEVVIEMLDIEWYFF